MDGFGWFDIVLFAVSFWNSGLLHRGISCLNAAMAWLSWFELVSLRSLSFGVLFSLGFGCFRFRLPKAHCTDTFVRFYNMRISIVILFSVYMYHSITAQSSSL